MLDSSYANGRIELIKLITLSEIPASCDGFMIEVSIPYSRMF
jgi:hypothetical protein